MSVFCVFFCLCACVQLAGSQFPNQGLKPGLWQWQHRVLTTGPPRNFYNLIFLHRHERKCLFLGCKDYIRLKQSYLNLARIEKEWVGQKFIKSYGKTWTNILANPLLWYHRLCPSPSPAPMLGAAPLSGDFIYIVLYDLRDVAIESQSQSVSDDRCLIKFWVSAFYFYILGCLPLLFVPFQILCKSSMLFI